MFKPFPYQSGGSAVERPCPSFPEAGSTWVSATAAHIAHGPVVNPDAASRTSLLFRTSADSTFRAVEFIFCQEKRHVRKLFRRVGVRTFLKFQPLDFVPEKGLFIFFPFKGEINPVVGFVQNPLVFPAAFQFDQVGLGTLAEYDTADGRLAESLIPFGRRD